MIGTLGPEGTCHEHASRYYANKMGFSASFEYLDDFLTGAERLWKQEIDILIQCSAHPQVAQVVEVYLGRITVTDAFVCPTQEMGLIVRSDTVCASLGLMEATRHYTNIERFRTIHYEKSKPVVMEKLKQGLFDAGITYTSLAKQQPDLFSVEEYYGFVNLAWVVYCRMEKLP